MIKVSEREKKLLQVLIIVFSVVILYYLIVTPLVNFFSETEESLESNKEKLIQLDKIYKNYRELEQTYKKYSSLLKSGNDNITSLIEQWSKSTNVARHIAYTRRRQSVIQNKYIRITNDIKLEGVPIQSCLQFIYEIENSNKLLKINYLRINKALKGSNTYDVNMKIDSYTMK